jgi:RNA polymerase sigma factor (sigma-70 family)
MQELLEVTYKQNFEKIYRFFYYKVLDCMLAEDLTSETFLAFVEQIKKRKDIKNYNAFLYGVARVVFTKHLQKKYKEATFNVAPEYFEQYIEHVLFDAKCDKPLEDRAQKYIDLLPSAQKEVAYLRLVAKHTNKEIAQKLGKNQNYVKVTFRRALKSLKKLVACTP